ncbi:hypothetical protein [Paraburkholderia steynii]|uniref:hypothetical protein n=1 Tax=Paraburkholderia steynii TaxID=1245441 RepID=UPI00115FE1BB
MSRLGALVIASYGLMREPGAILLDVNPDKRTPENVRNAIELDGEPPIDIKENSPTVGPRDFG